MDLGDYQPSLDGVVRPHARVSKAYGSDELPRGRRQLAAMERIAVLSGRIHALVVPGVARREFPAHDERESGPVPLRHRGQLSATGVDRKGTCAKGPAVVRRNRRVLEWNDAGDLDGERSGLDYFALDVRIQRQAGDD